MASIFIFVTLQGSKFIITIYNGTLTLNDWLRLYHRILFQFIQMNSFVFQYLCLFLCLMAIEMHIMDEFDFLERLSTKQCLIACVRIRDRCKIECKSDEFCIWGCNKQFERHTTYCKAPSKPPRTKIISNSKLKKTNQ